jgi:O-antigen ligase
MISSGLLVALVGSATFMSEHQSSMVALVAAGVVLALHNYAPRAAIAAVIVGWLGATFLVVPAVRTAYAANLHKAEWLMVNARARIVLWEVTARNVSLAPVFGIGWSASATVDSQFVAPPLTAGDVVKHSPNHHAHNVYLQVWYELGVLGALAFSALGLSVLAAISRFDSATRGLALSCFVSAAVIGAFSWGIAQSWYMALMTFLPTLVSFARRP